MEPESSWEMNRSSVMATKRDGGACPSIIMSAYMWRNVNRQYEMSHTEERFISRSKLIGQNNM
jgi:hypothetical protein